MLEIFTGLNMGDVLQIIAPALFLIGAFICLTVVLGILSVIFMPDVRAEAVAAIKAFTRNVKVAAEHFLF